MIDENSKNTYSDEYLKSWTELSSMSNFLTSASNKSSSIKISIDEILKYHQNPYDNIDKIQRASKFLTNKYGILRDVVRMAYSLPTLKYSLQWSSYGKTGRNKLHDKKVKDFLKNINVVKLSRDILQQTVLLGTTVTCLRAGKYVQFLDLEDIIIRTQRNGRWIVEYDLKSLDVITDTNLKVSTINSLPDEITVQAYNQYKKTRDDSKRYVEISNCHVISIDNSRHSPYGLPLTMGSWLPLAQKDIIDNVERSVADRLIKQILILSVGDFQEGKPAPKPMIEGYFKEVSNLIQQKEGNFKRKSDNGTGVIALPKFMDLEALKIDTTLFKKDLYDKINDDVYNALGISKSLISGGGGNYASASVNSEKFFSFIFTIIEQIETVIDDYLTDIIPKTIDCEIKFDQTTTLDKQRIIDDKKEIFMQMGIAQPYIEAVFGENSFQALLEQATYEKKELKTESVLYPPQNAYTMSGKDSKNKNDDNIDNENTEKTKNDNGNNTPSLK